MSKKSLLIIMLIASAKAWAMDTSGYMRAGLGTSQNGTKQQCYRAVGSIGKYRLGNECENYLELGLTHKFPKSEESDYNYIARVLFALQNAGHRDWESTAVDISFNPDSNVVNASQDTQIAFREAYAAASRDFAKDKVYWAGKRFYRRRDIHILDYFLMTNIGSGFGVENWQFGKLTWHGALLRNLPKNAGPSQNNIDLKVSGLRLPALGLVEATYVYGFTFAHDAYTAERKWAALDGSQVSLLFDQAFTNGFNLFAIQYGQSLFGANGAMQASVVDQFGAWGSQNIAHGDKETLEARERSYTLRFTDQWVHKWSHTMSQSLVLLYQKTHFGGYRPEGQSHKRPDLQECSFGFRPIFHLPSDYDLAFEYGYSRVEKAILSSSDATKYLPSELHKMTIAPAITREAQFFSRPQIRLFLTHAFWNKDSRGKIAPEIYGAQTAGWSAGSQIEVWW